MNIKVSFTDESLSDVGNKTLVYLENGKIHISNFLTLMCTPFLEKY